MASADRIARGGINTVTAKVLAEEINDTAGAVTSVNGNTGVVVLDATDVGALATPTPVAAIPDVTVTGVYGDDDDAIQAAINGILAVLRTQGFVTP